MSEVSKLSNHVKGWINYLTDFRMCQMKYFIHPVKELIKDESMSSDEKVDKIKIIIEEHSFEQSKLKAKDYGVITA